MATASAYYTPTVGGVFKIVGEGKDKDNNTIRSATYQWIATTNEFVNWRIENNDRIDLVADKKEYHVGDTAKVLIPAPFKDALALMTIERGGILQVKSLGVIGNSDTLEIPITEDFAADCVCFGHAGQGPHVRFAHAAVQARLRRIECQSRRKNSWR